MSRSFGVLMLLIVATGGKELLAQEPAKPTEPAKAEAEAVPVPAPFPAPQEFPKIEDIKPLPSVAIPNDPPPHEGAMFDLPVTIEPPDIIHITVLEALTGRPLDGDHLVHPDGTISLGFYGSIHVRGLTTEQAKIRIVLHMRQYINDEVLGLLKAGKNWQYGDPLEPVPISQSNRVFVQIVNFNSKVYYVQGDVSVPGRLPWTGHDTVLDALNYAGGLLPGADTDKIHLFRPARGTQPARHYKIDYEAIMMANAAANLQLFPGDRLVIGKNLNVKKIPTISHQQPVADESDRTKREENAASKTRSRSD